MSNRVTVADFRFNLLAKKYLNQILISNRLTYGPFTQKIEREFARLHRRRWAVFTSSGTGALWAGLATLKEVNRWPDGSEVIVPAVSFITTANIVYQLGLKPVFVDVDPDTFNLDPVKTAAKISKKTKAIIPVHLLGLPADMPAIMALAKTNHLTVFEDSCDAMFVGIKQQPVGSWGKLAAFSTYVAHLLPAGVGGFLVGNDPKLEKIARSYIFHGRHTSYLSIDDDDKRSGRIAALKNRFRFDRLGNHYRLTEIEAAIGLSQLTTGDWRRNLDKRQRLAARLIKKLAPFQERLQLPHTPAEFSHAYMMFPVVIKDAKIKKWDLIEYLENHGIETRELLPLVNQPIYRRLFRLRIDDFPEAKRLWQNAFYFGCHPYLTMADMDFVADTIYEFLSK